MATVTSRFPSTPSDGSGADEGTVGVASFEQCAHGDGSLTDGEWHPVAIDTDGATTLASFGDDERRATWAAGE